MYLFLDTEFTHFNCTVQGLLSLALTNESGASWYGVNAAHPEMDCSTFVVHHVLPYLETPAPLHTEPLAILAVSLADWIEQQAPHATVVVDYDGDWHLLKDLFALAGVWPKNLAHHSEMLYRLLEEYGQDAVEDADDHMTQYLDDRDWPNHNARADAEANWYAWSCARAAQAPAAAKNVYAGSRVTRLANM